MTRISNVDQVLLLLQEQLKRVGKNRRANAKRSASRTNPTTSSPIDRVRLLSALDALSEDDVRRALVQGLLAEAFGERLTNDASFQSVVDRVARIIAESPDGPALLDRAVLQLRTTSV